MNEERKFLLDIFERFGSQAQDAMDFVKRNESTAEKAETKPSATPTTAVSEFLPNGVYYVLKDGTHTAALSEGNDIEVPDKENIAFIGIAYDTHKFGVPIHGNKGSHKLLNCGSNYPDKDSECMCEADAILDWDFVGATKHIQKLGTDIPLNDGEYLPTAPVFLAMYKFRDLLNEALQYAGGEPIDFTEDFWFGRRYSSSYAWLFHGGIGTLYNTSVNSSYLVQAVTLWK